MKPLPEGVHGAYRRGCEVLEIDTCTARYKGEVLCKLSQYQWRKFENLLFLQYLKDRPLKFIYH